MSSTTEEPTVGLRTWLIALLAAVSTQDPATVLRVGPLVAILVVLTGRLGQTRVGGAVVFSTLFALWAIASLAWTNFPETTTQGVLVIGSAVILFIATLELVKTTAQLQIVALGFVGGALVSVVQVFVQNRGRLGEVERLSLEGLNQNYLAYSLSTAFAMLVLLWATAVGWRRLWLACAAIALLVGVEATGTRGAYLGVAVLVGWLIACRVFPRPPLAFLLTAIGGASLVIVSGFWDTLLASWDVGERSTGDWSGRLALWPVARELWSDNLWIGVGYSGFNYASGFGVGAHNVFLQLGSGVGVIGVVLFGGIWVCALLPVVRKGEARGRLLIGSYLAVAAPAYLTGYWESAPAAWIALAVFSRVQVLGSPSISQSMNLVRKP